MTPQMDTFVSLFASGEVIEVWWKMNFSYFGLLFVKGILKWIVHQPQTHKKHFFFWSPQKVGPNWVAFSPSLWLSAAAPGSREKRFSSNWDDWQQTFTEAKYFSCQLRGRKSRLPVIPIHWFYVPAHHSDWAETAAHRQNHQSAWIGSSLAKADINRRIFSVCPVNAYILKSPTHQPGCFIKCEKKFKWDFVFH